MPHIDNPLVMPRPTMLMCTAMTNVVTATMLPKFAVKRRTSILVPKPLHEADFRLKLLGIGLVCVQTLHQAVFRLILLENRLVQTKPVARKPFSFNSAGNRFGVRSDVARKPFSANLATIRVEDNVNPLHGQRGWRVLSHTLPERAVVCKVAETTGVGDALVRPGRYGHICLNDRGDMGGVRHLLRRGLRRRSPGWSRAV